MDEQKSACVAVVGTGADVAPAVLADAEAVQRASGPAETVELALG